MGGFASVRKSRTWSEDGGKEEENESVTEMRDAKVGRGDERRKRRGGTNVVVGGMEAALCVSA